MVKYYKIIFTLLTVGLIYTPLNSQTSNKINRSRDNGHYVDLFMGVQVSGIKQEDFVYSNYLPYFQLSFERG